MCVVQIGGSHYVTSGVWVYLGDFSRVSITFDQGVQNVMAYVQVRNSLCIVSAPVGFLLLLLVMKECLTNFVGIYGNWLFLARDMDPAGLFCKIYMVLDRLG